MSNEKEFKLFVGGVHLNTDDETFRGYFEQFGKVDVTNTKVMKDPGSDRSRGFGFVVFEEKESCDKCLETKDHQIDGRSVEVKVAVPKGSTPTGMSRRNRVKKIFLGGISPETTNEDIIEALERACGEGCVADAKVMTEKGTEKPRGFAFAHLKDPRYNTDDQEYDEAAYDVVDKLLRSHKFIKIRDRDVEVKGAVSQDDMKRENEVKASRGGSYSNYGGLSNYGYGGSRGEPSPYMYSSRMYDPAMASAAYYQYGYPAQQRGATGRDYMAGYTMYDRTAASGYGYDTSTMDYSKYYNQLGSMMGSYPSTQSSYGPTRAYSSDYKGDRSDRGDSSRANFHPYRR